MSIPGTKTLTRTLRQLRSRLADGALILGYHCVDNAGDDPFSLRVTPRHFAEQVEVLSRYAYPLGLAELVRRLGTGGLPRRAVVLTFDDGYVDALHTVKPILERHDVPATVFVSTGYLGREFWWDRLARMVMSPESLPTGPLPPVGAMMGSTLDADTPATRQRLLASLHGMSLPLSHSEREVALAQLAAWTRYDLPDPPARRALTAEEVIRLANGGLVDIGAHTVTHPVLASLSEDDQQYEINKGKSDLEGLLGKPVSGFSYPNGSASNSVAALVRQAGFTYACSSTEDVVWQGSDLLHLPRLWVADWDGEVFLSWLKRWSMV